jgi:hypothetical protein
MTNEPTKTNEPEIWLMPICELCTSGAGGECHTPGCSFFLKDGPEEKLPTEFMQRPMIGESVQPDWCRLLTFQQQSILFLASRGPDGIPKDHPVKDIQRALRGCVFKAAFRHRLLEYGEAADSFMSMDKFGSAEWFELIFDVFFKTCDQLPHHYLMHLIHAAEILGYKHPDSRFKTRWLAFYYKNCEALHMTPETEEQMDIRLNDFGYSG